MLVFYISGHGFGHASRDIEVINAVARLAPGTRIAVRTMVPRWFLDASLETPVEVLPGETDTGVIQPDSLSIDEADTARRAADFYGHFDIHVDREAARLSSLGPTVVVGDIPPLAFAAAARVGVPSIALANFTWDWIYQGFPRFAEDAPGVLETIAEAYATATLTLRLPFAGGFGSMSNIQDVPLIGRRARVSRDDVRRRLHIADDRPLVLASFGGHGRAVSLDRAVSPGRFTLVATDHEAPPGDGVVEGLRILHAGTLREAGITYTDLLGACDVVAAKLGYGIVSECIANGVALLYTFRGRFVEQERFTSAMPGVLRCRAIDRTALLDGRWSGAIDALLAQPPPPHTMRIDGARVVAETILAAGCSAREA